MDRRLIVALGALVLLVAAVFGLSLVQRKDPPSPVIKTQTAEARQDNLQQACASKATYDRLKQVVFEQAARAHNSDPANLDLLAAHSIVRMENPVVKSRDEALNVTVCTGRFVLEVPPGAERAFGGQPRLVADVEYAAQAAADGSGLVYRLSGAEPIVGRLAAFDLQGQRFEPPGDAAIDATAEAPVPPAAIPPRSSTPAPVPQPAPQTAAVARPSPSFNCGSARTRGEVMVCNSHALAAQDRAMSSLYFSALSGAGKQEKRALRQTRDRFLAYRDRCSSEACIAEAYEGRIREIRDIMADFR